MKHGKLTTKGLKCSLAFLIDEWYENVKEGTETKKIVRDLNGGFDISIEMYDHDIKQCLIQIRVLGNGKVVYQYNVVLYAGTIDSYLGKKVDLIGAIATDIYDTIQKREEGL